LPEVHRLRLHLRRDEPYSELPRRDRGRAPSWRPLGHRSLSVRSDGRQRLRCGRAGRRWDRRRRGRSRAARR